MDGFEPHVHGPNRDVQIFESREQIEKVVWCQSQMRWFDAMGHKVQSCKGKGRG